MIRPFVIVDPSQLILKAKQGGKYIRRVPYTDSKGKKRYRYYYSEQALARDVQRGEEVWVGGKRVRVHDVIGDKIRIEVDDQKMEITGAQWSKALAHYHGDKYLKAVEQRARQSIDAVLKHVPKSLLKDLEGDSDSARLADLQYRAPEIFKRLQKAFQRAGVNPFRAKATIAQTLERRGWAPEARAAAIGLFMDHRSMGIRSLIQASESLAGAGAQTEAKHVAAAVDLGAGIGDVARIAARAETETESLRKALDDLGTNPTARARAHVLAQALASTASARLEMLSQAFPGLKDRALDPMRETRSEAVSAAPGPLRKAGAVATVFVAGEGGRPQALGARYELREASEVVASHDPVTFQPHKKYPEGVQERQYHRDTSEQGKVRVNAQTMRPEFVINTNPDAVNGPPIVTGDNTVLGGNSRAMSIQRAYAEHPEQAQRLRDYLADHAHEVGLRSEDVHAFKNPVLVRVMEASPDTETQRLLVRQMNESFTQGMDPRTMQVAQGRRLNENTIKVLGQDMAEGETLNTFLGTPRAKRFLGELNRAGVIDSRNANQYMKKDGSSLNQDGRGMVARVLVGRVIGDADLLGSMHPSTIENVANSLPHLIRAKEHGDGYDVVPSLRTAMDALVRLQDRVEAGAMPALKPDMSPKDYDTIVESYFRELPGVGEDHPVLHDQKARTLLEALIRRPGSNQFPGIWKDYAREAERNPEGQGGLFGGKDPSAVFGEVLEQHIAKTRGEKVAPPKEPEPVRLSGGKEQQVYLSEGHRGTILESSQNLDLEPGQRVQGETSDGWIYVGTVTEKSPHGLRNHARVQIDKKEPVPAPPVGSDGELTLPQSRSKGWNRGDVVEYEGKKYKVTRKPIPGPNGTTYQLKEQSEKESKSLAAKVSMDSERELLEAVGGAIRTKDGEWLHVKKPLKRAFHSALGRDYIWIASGNIVSEDKAAKLNATHPPYLARALRMDHGERVKAPMPDDAVTLVPKDLRKLIPSGERVAVDGDSILHERTGDPDMRDSIYKYVVRIKDPDLVQRVKQFVKTQQKKTAKKSLIRPFRLVKAGPYLGPRGGKWADPKHTIPWKAQDEKRGGVRTGVIPVDHKAVAAIADKLLGNSNMKRVSDQEWRREEGLPPLIQISGKSDYIEGPAGKLSIELEPSSTLDDEEWTDVDLDHDQPIGGSLRTMIMAGNKHHILTLKVPTKVAVPRVPALKRAMRSTIAHEITHQADPGLQKMLERRFEEGDSGRKPKKGSGSSEDDYEAYLNQPHEVAATLQQIQRDLITPDAAEHAKNLWNRKQKLDAGEADPDLGPIEKQKKGWKRSFDMWLRTNSRYYSERMPWYNEANKKRINQMIYRTFEGLGQGTIEPKEKSLIRRFTLVKAQELPANHAEDRTRRTGGRKLAKRIRWNGLDISVENARGSTRTWYDPENDEEGTTTMLYDYGYVRGSIGADGDHVDVFVGPDPNAPEVYIVDQMKRPRFKSFDEQKVMLGFPSIEAARTAYLKHYNDKRFLGRIRAMGRDEFCSKVRETSAEKPLIRSFRGPG